jgi:DNA-binding NarL/FixJ family response regulator
MNRPFKPKQKLHVLIVDDHPVVREGIRRRIESQPDMAVYRDVSSYAEALDCLSAHTVDIAIVDISLPGRSGIDLIKQIRASKYPFPILVLSVHYEATYAQRALTAGAQGYLLKSDAPHKIVEAVRKILAGDFYISDHMASKLFAYMGRIADPSNIVANLSDRELEVLEAIGNGLSTAEIAKALSLSISTIDTYKQRLKNKLNLRNASELATYASTWSLNAKEQ